MRVTDISCRLPQVGTIEECRDDPAEDDGAGVDRGEQRVPHVVDRLDDREDVEVSLSGAADQADRRKAAANLEIDDDHVDIAPGSPRLLPGSRPMHLWRGSKESFSGSGYAPGYGDDCMGGVTNITEGAGSLSPVG